MKLEFQNGWLRLLIEFFPGLPEIRRHRIPPAHLESQTERLLRRRIARKLGRCDPSGSRPRTPP